MRNLDRTLDRALSGRSEPDEEVAGLVETARLFTQAFDVEPQPAFRERALFAAAVGSRGRSGFPLFRLFAPVAAGLGLLAALAFASGSALPGDALYPVREVLQDVGLNEGVLADAMSRMDLAEDTLDDAEDFLGDRSGRTTGLAVEAIQELAPVESLLQEADLRSGELTLLLDRRDALIERATSLIAEATKEKSVKDEGEVGGSSLGDSEQDGDRRAGSGTDEADDDGSGSGDGDSSGSGSDDESESSGSGDTDADDSSGPGDGEREDSSGSGSDDETDGSDGDGDDNSGSDGDADDSSGSGSDDATDGSDSADGEDRSGSDDELIDSLDEHQSDDEVDPDSEDTLD